MLLFERSLSKVTMVPVGKIQELHVHVNSGDACQAERCSPQRSHIL